MNAPRNNTTSPAQSLDGISKQQALDAEMGWAKVELLLETLDTRKSDRLDIHEIPVWSIRDLVRHAFESGYREGLHTGYRQGRTDAAREAAREEAPTNPRNPELSHPRSAPHTARNPRRTGFAADHDTTKEIDHAESEQRRFDRRRGLCRPPP